MSGFLFLALSVIVTTFGQLSYKQYYASHRRVYQLAAVALFVLAVPCTYLAVRQLGIGRVYIGSAASYVLAPVFAGKLFQERISQRQWLALALISVGVIIYNV